MADYPGKIKDGKHAQAVFRYRCGPGQAKKVDSTH